MCVMCTFELLMNSCPSNLGEVSNLEAFRWILEFPFLL